MSLLMLQEEDRYTDSVNEMLDSMSPGSGTAKEMDINTIAEQVVEWLFMIGLFVAVASLIIVAIRIMFARATGDVASAKTSSNGIGWILGAVILILVAPMLVQTVWTTFSG